MSSPLKQNTATIQELLNTINSLPDAGGVELPELTNEGSSAELFAGKELIDGNGEKVTGTFTIDSELSTQDNLISQIQTALQNKAAATGEDVTSETTAYTNKLATLETAITALETELEGKAAGGGSGGVNTVSITLSNCTGFGFDASGASISISNATAEFLGGVVYLPFAQPYTIQGNYIRHSGANMLYKFTTAGSIIGSNSSGGGGA